MVEIERLKPHEAALVAREIADEIRYRTIDLRDLFHIAKYSLDSSKAEELRSLVDKIPSDIKERYNIISRNYIDGLKQLIDDIIIESTNHQ